jgi:PncC family amidohydrolase
MARNIQKISKSDISLSITGIAGPNGGTIKKPVGLVYIGICKKSKINFRKYFFNSKLNRAQIQKKTCMKALKLIEEFL